MDVRGLFRDFAPLLMLLLSGLVWGMKLEARYDRLEARQAVILSELTEIRTDLKRGILPLTQQRLEMLERRMDRVETDQHRRRE